MKTGKNTKETNIEILKHKMDNAVAKKDREVKKLEKNISEMEDIVLIMQRELRWCDDMLQRLRLKREISETQCFREILKLHQEILGIKNQ